MGGMAAQIPIKGMKRAANEAAHGQGARRTSCARCRYGHDGTWVAHPALIAGSAGNTRQVHAVAEPASSVVRADVCVTRDEPIARRCSNGTDQPRGLRQQRRGVHCATPPRWLNGLGLRANPSPLWRTPPRPRSRARSCGGGCITPTFRPARRRPGRAGIHRPRAHRLRAVRSRAGWTHTHRLARKPACPRRCKRAERGRRPAVTQITHADDTWRLPHPGSPTTQLA